MVGNVRGYFMQGIFFYTERLWIWSKRSWIIKSWILNEWKKKEYEEKRDSIL